MEFCCVINEMNAGWRQSSFYTSPGQIVKEVFAEMHFHQNYNIGELIVSDGADQ